VSSPHSANKRLVRRWFDQVWNKQKATAIDQMFAATGVAHAKGGDGGAARGPEGFKPFHQAYLNAFPDLRITVDDVVAEGRKVAVRWTATGTHRGNGLGFSATQKPMRMAGMTFVVVRNGKIVEGWDSYDSFSMFQQLGVASLPVMNRTP
jgi:steroid delta-isomerase-like uncharacterized protein